MSQDSLLKHSNVYELYGVDFMLDDEMKLWYIESNSNPQLSGFTKDKNSLYLSVVMGTMDIQYAYYRSRMMRVMEIVKRLQEDMGAKKEVDCEKYRNEYQKAIRNRLEPRYKISSKNMFVPLIDENIAGEGAYFGNIDPECL